MMPMFSWHSVNALARMQAANTSLAGALAVLGSTP